MSRRPRCRGRRRYLVFSAWTWSSPCLNQSVRLRVEISSLRGFLDHLHHVARTRKESYMTGHELRRIGIGALGVETLEVWIDCPVLGRNDVPARNRLPRRRSHGGAEHRTVDRLLGGGKDPRPGRGKADTKHVVKLCTADVENT